jgi:hypothetical protein
VKGFGSGFPRLSHDPLEQLLIEEAVLLRYQAKEAVQAKFEAENEAVMAEAKQWIAEGQAGKH